MVDGDNYQYSSGAAVCDTNQTNAGCITQPALAKVELDDFRGRAICFKREGEAQIKSATATRPVPKSAGVCPNGYDACGTGTAQS